MNAPGPIKGKIMKIRNQRILSFLPGKSLSDKSINWMNCQNQHMTNMKIKPMGIINVMATCPFLKYSCLSQPMVRRRSPNYIIHGAMTSNQGEAYGT
jgi:hypothetical protein